MRQYFFYDVQVSGEVSLQFPGVANSVGVAQEGKVYVVKVEAETTANKTFRDALLAAVVPGATLSEAALLTAITTAITGAKVREVSVHGTGVFKLN